MLDLPPIYYRSAVSTIRKNAARQGMIQFSELPRKGIIDIEVEIRFCKEKIMEASKIHGYFRKLIWRPYSLELRLMYSCQQGPFLQTYISILVVI